MACWLHYKVSVFELQPVLLIQKRYSAVSGWTAALFSSSEGLAGEASAWSEGGQGPTQA